MSELAAEVPVYPGHAALVDQADYDRMMKYSWHLSDRGYAMCSRPGYKSGIGMHRMLLDPPKGMYADHINGDRLDNRRSNLRIVNPLQNSQNRANNNNCVSKYKGVCWKVANNKWQARIRIKGKQHHIGLYDTEIEAARAYNEAAYLNHGNFARLNVIDGDDIDPMHKRKFLIQNETGDWEDSSGQVWEPRQKREYRGEFETLRSANEERQKEWDKGGHMTLSYMGNELAGETGELCNVVKKLERETFNMPGSRATVQQAAEEAADVVICVDLLARRLGFSLWPAIVAKFNKTSDKNGFTIKIEG